jgi:hypothetical protein
MTISFKNRNTASKSFASSSLPIVISVIFIYHTIHFSIPFFKLIICKIALIQYLCCSSAIIPCFHHLPFRKPIAKFLFCWILFKMPEIDIKLQPEDVNGPIVDIHSSIRINPANRNPNIHSIFRR